ncbi:MAG: FAD-binding oxidoreductase, partial [Gammaproteobacteria bacterium]
MMMNEFEGDRIMGAEERASLLEALRTLLPPDAVLCEEEEVRPYECDGLSAYRQRPVVVVLPDSLDQVRAIMRL